MVARSSSLSAASFVATASVRTNCPPVSGCPVATSFSLTKLVNSHLLIQSTVLSLDPSSQPFPQAPRHAADPIRLAFGIRLGNGLR